MTTQNKLGGSFALRNSSLTVNRMGYGAMQLAGPGVWGAPRDPEEAVRVLREAIETGVNHIDTSDFYGPHVTNQVIKQALHPYADGLVIVTKVGARRGADKSWIHALARQELIDAVHDNLRNLGLERLDVVNLRVGGIEAPAEGSIEEPLTVLAELKQQGLIRHLGLSNVTARQLAEAQKISEIVCIQNMYNVVRRSDDAFIEELGRQGIAYVPFFPLGGFTPLQSEALDAAAASVEIKIASRLIEVISVQSVVVISARGLMKSRFRSDTMLDFQVGTTEVIFKPPTERRPMILKQLVHTLFELRHGRQYTPEIEITSHLAA